MMNKEIVFDASALLALIQQESGNEMVEKHIGNVIMSAVNVSEVITVLANNGIEEEQAKLLTNDMIEDIIPFDAEQAYLTALLRKSTKKHGLSFGDRACLSLAQIKKTTVVTADKIWANLHLKDVHIQVIR
jgi:PIN domain nuclease of toxin-antitoxin system